MIIAIDGDIVQIVVTNFADLFLRIMFYCSVALSAIGMPSERILFFIHIHFTHNYFALNTHIESCFLSPIANFIMDYCFELIFLLFIWMN